MALHSALPDELHDLGAINIFTPPFLRDDDPSFLDISRELWIDQTLDPFTALPSSSHIIQPEHHEGPASTREFNLDAETFLQPRCRSPEPPAEMACVTSHDLDPAFDVHAMQDTVVPYLDNWWHGDSADTTHDDPDPASVAFQSIIGPAEPGPSHAKRRRDSQESTERHGKKRSQRTLISAEAKAILEKHFSSNPYPTDGELALLSGMTGLAIRNIRTWYSNARSRKETSSDLTLDRIDKQAVTLDEHGRGLRAPSPSSSISAASLDKLNRLSPAPSAISLERYLTTPLTEDSVPTAAVEAAIHNINGSSLPDVLKSVSQTGANGGIFDSATMKLGDQGELATPRCKRVPTRHGRIYLACDACRLRKVRCSGETPSCEYCIRQGRTCEYTVRPQNETPFISTATTEPLLPQWPSRPQSPQRAFSNAGSESSMGSANSLRSWGSRVSIDSRGSRRGRKRWTCSQPSRRTSTPGDTITAAHAAMKRALLSGHRSSYMTEDCGLEAKQEITAVPAMEKGKDGPSKRPYFCTWPDCNSTFRFRFEWARHEEAIHYCPYHWICCLDTTAVMRLPHCFVCGERDVLLSHLAKSHFSNCAAKSQGDRTFVREDQLASHIKRIHYPNAGKTSIPKDLLSSWKIDNPLFQTSFLRCGFCGEGFDTWAQRQSHVFEHLQKGACKSAWWPERQPLGPSKIRNNDAYTCSNCGAEFEDFAAALQQHPACITWSCRYLHDSHAAFATGFYAQFANRFSAACKLCDFEYYARPDSEHLELDLESKFFIHELEDHAATHALHDCEQIIFKDLNTFTKHLADEHTATHSRVSMDYRPWQCIQFLEMLDGRGLIRTSPMFIEMEICPSNQQGYTFTFLDAE